MLFSHALPTTRWSLCRGLECSNPFSPGEGGSFKHSVSTNERAEMACHILKPQGLKRRQSGTATSLEDLCLGIRGGHAASRAQPSPSDLRQLLDNVREDAMANPLPRVGRRSLPDWEVAGGEKTSGEGLIGKKQDKWICLAGRGQRVSGWEVRRVDR